MATTTATLDNLCEDNVQPDVFPFMSLHPELRQLVYQEVLSNRAIILYEFLDPPGLYMCGRRYWHFRLKDSRDPTYDNIPLLQTSKQILAEAQPFLAKYTPSHLTLSKELRRQPEYLYEKELADIGLPFNHITHLNLNVKILGTNPRYPRDCPGPPGSARFFRTNCTIGEFVDPDEGPPPDPQRLPDLKGIWHMSQFFRLLPALREIHIYDVLKHHLSTPAPPCPCPIAGSADCICGKCQCDCIVYPALPSSPTDSIAQVKEELHNALLFRFRAGLPPVDEDPIGFRFRRYSDYHAILEPLAHGVQVFFHEELAFTVPTDEGRAIHKGVWRARYHLSPPDTAPRPAEAPTEPAELPRFCHLRGEKEQQRRREEGVVSLSGIDYGFLKDDTDEDPRLRKIPEVLDGTELVAFEGGLELEIVDEKEFDRVVERQEMEGYRKEVEGRYAAFWRWG